MSITKNEEEAVIKAYDKDSLETEVITLRTENDRLNDHIKKFMVHLAMPISYFEKFHEFIVTPNPFIDKTLAEIAYETYQKCFNDLSSWKDISIEQQIAWSQVADTVISSFDRKFIENSLLKAAKEEIERLKARLKSFADARQTEWNTDNSDNCK